MAIFIRNGKYYYWKEKGGRNIYLGTENTPKIDRINECIEKLEKRKKIADKEINLLKKLAGKDIK